MTNEIQRLRFRVRQLEREVRALRAESYGNPGSAEGETRRPGREDERAPRGEAFGGAGHRVALDIQPFLSDEGPTPVT